LPQIKRPSQWQLKPHTLIAPGDPRDGYWLIVFFRQFGVAIVNPVQFSTHCDQI
jgi:hypothetical protein